MTCNATDIVLTGATLHYYNTSGHCAPTNVYSNTATDWDWDNDEVCHHAVHIPADVSSADNLSFTPTDEGYIVYVPEFDNTDTKSFISVSLEHTDGTEVNLDNTNIYFSEYTDEGTLVENTDFNIVRNHWYKYDITNVDDGELIFQYRVMKWNVESSAIGWNVEFKIAAYNSEDGIRLDPDYDDATVGDDEATYCYVLYPRYSNNDHDGLTANSSYAGFSFQLTAPEGAIWKAYLKEPTGNENFRFGTGQYDIDGDGTYDRFNVTTGRARQEPYQIQIRAVNSWTEGTSFTDLASWGEQVEQRGEEIYADFYITVSLDGVEEYVLDINAPDESLTDSRWNDNRRFAGGDNKYIRIWQLKATNGTNFDNLINNLPDSHSIKTWWNAGN